MKHLLLALVMLVCAPVAFAQSHADAKGDIVGTILSVEGPASITSLQGSSVPATLNASLHPGDVLQTGKDGRIFVQMIDNTELTLGENGQMTVDEYVFDAQKGEGNRAVYTIAKGAFLFVDGLLGKVDKPDIQVNIPVGSIGIRGTKFWGGTVDGAYGVIVGEGEVEVKNARGAVALTKGQGTTIAGRDSRPDTPRAWSSDKIQRATTTVALKDAPAIGRRMREQAKRNTILRQRHQEAVEARKKARAAEGREDDKNKRRKRQNQGEEGILDAAPDLKPDSRSSTGNAIKDAASDLRDTATPAANAVREKTGAIKETVTETAQDARDTAKDTGASVKDAIKDTGAAVKDKTVKTLEKTNALTVRKRKSTSE